MTRTVLPRCCALVLLLASNLLSVPAAWAHSQHGQKSRQLLQTPVLAVTKSASAALPTLPSPRELAFIAEMDEFYAHGAFMKTSEAVNVDPANPLPEHPKPQAYRGAWQNLNGIWQVQNSTVDQTAPPPFGQDMENLIVVPFCVESPLSGVGVNSSALTYRKVFQVNQTLACSGCRLLLHIERADHEATVYLNKVNVGSHTGGYGSFALDVTDVLIPEENQDQELIIQVVDESEFAMQPLGKQRQNPTNPILYTSCSGIWGTVWLESVPAAYITEALFVPDVDNDAVNVTISGSTAAQGLDVSVTIYQGKLPISMQIGVIGQQMVFPLAAPQLWSPDSPFLYGAVIQIQNDPTQSADTMQSYFGMRKLHVSPDRQGVPRIFLNNQMLFQWGFLDQGYIPEGVYTYPTEKAMVNDLTFQKGLGANMVRKHMKVETDRWYHLTDTLGLLVWQDIPSQCGKDPGAFDNPGWDTGSPPNVGCWRDDRTIDPQSAAQFRTEMKEIIQQHVAFPSVVEFTIFNEAWGEFDVANQTQIAMSVDPAFGTGSPNHFLFSDASGWTDHKVGNIFDVHSYDGSLNATEAHFALPAKGQTRANAMGEYGGVPLFIEGHTFSTWEQLSRLVDFGTYLSATSLLATAMLERLAWVKTMSQDFLNVAVVTQVTDVENELNGLLTYDRAVSKLEDTDLAAVRAAVQDILAGVTAMNEPAASAGSTEG